VVPVCIGADIRLNYLTHHSNSRLYSYRWHGRESPFANDRIFILDIVFGTCCTRGTAAAFDSRALSRLVVLANQGMILETLGEQRQTQVSRRFLPPGWQGNNRQVRQQ
jgi:hypothetical protein